MRLNTLLLLLCTLAACDTTTPSQQVPLSIDVRSELVAPRHYIAARTTTPITIDGRADEAAWQTAPFSDPYIDIEGEKTPTYTTRMKLLWDENYLYVYAHLEEPHIWGNLTQRDTVIFYNNDFEVFVAPAGKTSYYGEIEINALGTVWDLLLSKPYRDGGKAINHWNLDDLQSAIYIEGTLNDPSDTDEYWSVELAIPMPALLELKDHPRDLPVEGEQWRINFSRVNWDFDLVDGVYARKKLPSGKYQPEYNWVWSNQAVINMHEPEKWGTLQFTESTDPTAVAFRPDAARTLEQVAYALFRQTKQEKQEELMSTTVGTQQPLRVTFGEGRTAAAVFNKTNFGFEYKVYLPDSDDYILINEAGVVEWK